MDSLTGRHAMARSSLLLLFSPAALLTPVHPSTQARDARVAGRVVTSAGTPAAGAHVRITATDTGLDIPLLAPAGPSRLAAETDAGPDGRFSGPLPGAYVPGTETDTDWIVTASRPAAAGQASGPSSSFEFEVNTAVHEAPDLRLWESPPVVTLDGYRAAVTLPEGAPRGTRPSVRLGPLMADGTSATFDLRRFEPEGDRRPERLVARGVAYSDVRVNHREGRTIYHQTLASPAVALAPPGLVPPSRGSPCTVTSADGRVTSPQPCRATDGDFFRPVSQPRAPAGDSAGGRGTTTTIAGVTSVTVELSVATDVESVFVRTCDRTCVVEVSVDGSSWARPSSVEILGQSIDELSVARFTPVAGGRFVRVSRPGGTLAVTEISAWPALPAANGGDSPATPARPLPATGTPRGSRLAPTGAAIVSLAVAGAALVAVSRRRHRRA